MGFPKMLDYHLECLGFPKVRGIISGVQNQDYTILGSLYWGVPLFWETAI